MKGIIGLVKFLAVFAVISLPCALAWSWFVTDALYRCTDSVPGGYFTPGKWVHDPVVIRDDVVEPGGMNQPDSIKSGWSKSRLLALWFAFSIPSAVASGFLASLPWTKHPARAGRRHEFPLSVPRQSH